MNSFQCLDEFVVFLRREFPQAELPENWNIAVEKCPANMSGDLTVNCFRFAKDLRTSPDKAADKAMEFFGAHCDVAAVEKIKAFVNITLTPGAVYRDSVACPDSLLAASRLTDAEAKRVLIEYSAPNTNKPQHLGHVRNNTLGMSLASLFARVGHDVIQINLVNDRGIHICKSMLAYERFGNGVTPESSGVKGDHLVGDFYVKYNSALKEQLDELRAAKPELRDESDEKLFLETEIGQ
ncbi:MAG: arginine--tRNA ligase, partial [Victivallales bacterium]